MTEESDLLAAILANPADDNVRLVYADWLQEQGEDARAEFIRVQVELARLPVLVERDYSGPYCPVCGEDDSYRHYHCAECEAECGMMGCSNSACEERRAKRAALTARETELLEANRAVWLERSPCKIDAWSLDEPMPPYIYEMRARYRRGFLTELNSSAADWLAHADAITAAHPIERVTLTTWPEIERLTVRQDHITFQFPGRALRTLFRVGGVTMDGRVEREMLSAEWPGIVFTVPVVSGTRWSPD